MSEPRKLIERLPDCLYWSPDGEIRIAGHRIGLYHFIVHYAEGYTSEMLLCQFPTVPLVVIHKVIVFYSMARKAARNAKIPGQKARILSSVSDRCFYLENRQAVDRYVAEYRAELDELAAHGRHAPSLAAMHARLEDRQKAVTTGADWV